jgi:nucleoside-diphosphate-sugar epimerase
VRLLLADPGTERVDVVDDLSSGHRWLLPEDARVRFEQLDVGCTDLSIEPETGVYHLAAHFANENSVDHPQADLLTNGMGTLRVLQTAAIAKASFVAFASAGCAAGHEDTPYQIHKSLGETYCRYFSREVPTRVFRFHNSYGPGELPGQYRNVIPRWIWAAMHDEDLVVFREGEDARDFVYVDDLVGVLVSQTDCGVTEIGTGSLTKTRRVAELIVAKTKSHSRVVLTSEGRRWDHPGRPAASASGDQITLEEGLERTITWFKTNYEAVKKSVEDK